MRTLRAFALAVTALLFAVGSLVAQGDGFSPPEVQLPWNGYNPTRIANGFSSIVNTPGATRITGSNMVSPWNSMWYNDAPEEYALTLPFDFPFLRNTYRAGTNILAGSNGYLSFNGAAPFEQNNNITIWDTKPHTRFYAEGSNLYGFYNKMIAPYWSNVGPNEVADGGIWYRTDGSVGNRVLTVEWRVGTNPSYTISTFSTGNFQTKLYEATGDIEFHYGPNSIITGPGGVWQVAYGALVGLKNLGQRNGNVAPVKSDYNFDEDNFLWFVNPDQVITNSLGTYAPGAGADGRVNTADDTIAITRINTIRYGDPPNVWDSFWPVEYAYIESYITPTEYYRSNPYYHYNFPTANGQRIAYRMHPISFDLAFDTMTFAPALVIPAYDSASNITVSATFRNTTWKPRSATDIRFDVYRDGARVYTSETRQITVGPSPSTGTVTFNAIPGVINSIYGEYVVKVYPVDPREEIGRNDTGISTYFIVPQHNVLPYRILQPFRSEAPLYTKYPVGVPVPIEARFWNTGRRDETNVPIGYRIFNAEGDTVFEASGIIPGEFTSISFRDANLPGWTPTTPGTYYIEFYTDLPTDQNPIDDVLPRNNKFGWPFEVAYEIELRAQGDVRPVAEVEYPFGRSIPVSASFRNDGIADATNSDARLVIKDPAGNVVYDESVVVLEVPADGGQVTQAFPQFTPTAGSGRYCATVTINNPFDPVASNNSYSWCFNVAKRLKGTYRIGFGERFRSVNAARDALFYYGVEDDVEFLIVNDVDTVKAPNNDGSVPAIDFRGHIVGVGPNATVTFRPHPSKSLVRLLVKSPSGIGFWFGRSGEENPSGYITFDGGAQKRLAVEFENVGEPENDLAVPFYFGTGASNYAVKNVQIRPVSIDEGRKATATLSVMEYEPAFYRFEFTSDLQQQISAGIMQRSIPPINLVTGLNDSRWDTLVNENNVFTGNVISDFAFGIVSTGMGPLYRVVDGRFVEYNNRNNTLNDNTIENVGRAGIALVYETGSEVMGNTIGGVENLSAPSTEKSGASTQATNDPHAVGVWVSAGGNATFDLNRGYSRDLEIERNTVSDVTANAGVAAGIMVETNENVLVTPGGFTQRFPLNAASNIEVRNNFTWNLVGSDATVGIGLVTPPAAPEGTLEGTLGDFLSRGNDVINNTVYNATGMTTGGMGEAGIVVWRNQATVLNNLIALTNSEAAGVSYVARATTDAENAMTLSITSDYNLFWVPNGVVGCLERVSDSSYSLPSPACADNLRQWQYLTGLDENSVEGNILPEFVSTTPGAVDLHLNPNRRNTLAGNRGTDVAGLVEDIDMEPRGQAATRGRFDIGADEFYGQVANNDVIADNITSPRGYLVTRGPLDDPTGFDVEYQMIDSVVDLAARIRNVGGLPAAGNAATLDVDYWNGSTWVSQQSFQRTILADVTEPSEANFGSFMPNTLAELGMTTEMFGTMEPNVTPIYRFTLRSADDDNFANNTFVKYVRFYTQRSAREFMLAVEDYQPGVNPATIADPIDLGNKLNADSMVRAFSQINWFRSGTIGTTQDFDLFERDRWPGEALDFRSWQTMVWLQGEDPEGITPEERSALKDQLNAWDFYRKAGLFIVGQEVARKHDVALTATNGMFADRNFVEDYLRADYVGNTTPGNYAGGRIQGLRITPGRFEVIDSTGVARDLPPMPSVLDVTTRSTGIAQGAYRYIDHANQTTGNDSLAGTTVATREWNVVFYAFDWRHAGKFVPDPLSGDRRMLLGAIDFLDQFGSVLPVEVSSFEAQQTGRQTVTVSWTTVSEIDLAAMDIERAEVLSSETGETLSAFSVIDSRTPAGSANAGADYRTLDQDVRLGGEYVYRLIGVEKDGSRVEVGVARVTIAGGADAAYSLSVLPNPVRTSGVIAWRAPRGEEVLVTIVDAKGATVQTYTASADGEGQLTLDATSLTSGTYTVVLRGASGEKLATRFTVTK